MSGDGPLQAHHLSASDRLTDRNLTEGRDQRMSIQVTCLPVGQLQANCYIVGCRATGIGVVIDPGGDADLILEAVKASGLQIAYILDTHGHPDHTMANAEVREGLAAAQPFAPKLAIHEGDRGMVEEPAMYWLLVGLRPGACKVDEILQDGAALQIGEMTFRVLSLPGHSPGSVVFVVDDAAFTGDVLFSGSIGRTDLPGGNMAQMMASLRRLVSELPPDTVVYSGHGPATTMAQELASNDWLQDI